MRNASLVDGGRQAGSRIRRAWRSQAFRRNASQRDVSAPFARPARAARAKLSMACPWERISWPVHVLFATSYHVRNPES